MSARLLLTRRAAHVADRFGVDGEPLERRVAGDVDDDALARVRVAKDDE